MTTELFIEPNGEIRFLHDDDVVEALEETGVQGRTVRASHVEPYGFSNLWYVKIEFEETVLRTITGGLGPIKTRKRALEVERAWLHHYFSTGEKLDYDPKEDRLVNRNLPAEPHNGSS